MPWHDSKNDQLQTSPLPSLDCRDTQSKWAEHEYVVFSKGTMEEPSGDCLKFETVFHAAGYADEFDSKEIRGTTRQ